MKRSLHIPFTLLIFIALFSLFLTFRIIPLRRNPAGALILNETLIHLAAADPEAPHLLNDIHNILAGNLPATSRPHVRTRSVLRHPVQPPNPNLRPLLLSWFNHRRFQASIMSDLLSLIKTPIDNTNRPYPSCAVVGNSGILLQHNHGPLIDTHAMVIRLNNARINGYQSNVGSKTTLSFVNSNILHLCARRSGCSCHPYGDTTPMIMYICQAAHFVDYLGCNATHKAPLLVTDPRFDLLCARIVKYYSLKRFVDETGRAVGEWGNFHDERMFHYSSGMQAVVMALGICDRVSVFGFGKSGEAKHHYHTNQKAELDLHDYEAEYVFYRDLVERPEAIPFLEGSGFKVPPVVFYH